MWGCAASQSTPPSPSRSTTVGGLEDSWALIEVMREALQHMEDVEEGRKDFRKPLIHMIDSLARLLFITDVAGRPGVYACFFLPRDYGSFLILWWEEGWGAVGHPRWWHTSPSSASASQHKVAPTQPNLTLTK